MTPTEQDSNGDGILKQRIYEEIAVIFAGKELSHKQISALMDDRKESVELIMRLITADRKRVALEEWDIANEAVLKNAHIISDEQEKLEALALVDPKKHNDKISSYMDKAFGFDLAFQPFAEARRKRIAELTSQQEEL